MPVAHTLYRLAVSLASDRRPAQAEPFFRQALQVHAYQQQHGQWSLDRDPVRQRWQQATALRAAARPYTSQQWTQDEPSAESVLLCPLAEPVMHGLAGTLGTLQRHAEAETYYRRLLAYSVAERGREHMDSLKAVTQLARCLQAQGMYGESEQLCEESLADCVMVLGSLHPTTQ
ncbi:hypothetical protein B484DRAFT_389353, partial [Ochromonadaceae sp. CCMP2298]